VPEAWWAGDGIALRELPTCFGMLNLTARRDGKGIAVELSLSGKPPAAVTLRYAGARRAEADGAACAIEDGLIRAPCFKRLVIE